VGFVFGAIARRCLGGGNNVLERLYTVSEVAFEVAGDIEDSFEEWHLQLALAWTVVDEESWVIAHAGDAQHHA
jgi:hypothetical protein